jgi:hypothetical protein
MTKELEGSGECEGADRNGVVEAVVALVEMWRQVAEFYLMFTTQVQSTHTGSRGSRSDTLPFCILSLKLFLLIEYGY